MPTLAKTVWAFAYCKHGCTRRCKLPVLRGVFQVSFTSTSTITPFPDRADGEETLVAAGTRPGALPDFGLA